MTVDTEGVLVEEFISFPLKIHIITAAHVNFKDMKWVKADDLCWWLHHAPNFKQLRPDAAAHTLRAAVLNESPGRLRRVASWTQKCLFDRSD